MPTPHPTTPRPSAGRRRRIGPSAQHGLTLLEALIALAILLVLLGTTLPGFGAAAERHRVDGAAAQLETGIQFARSHAVLRSQTVRLSFQRGAGGSCYVVHPGPSGSCRCMDRVGSLLSEPACDRGAQALHGARFDPASRLHVAANAGSLVFEPVHGTVTPAASIAVSGAAGETVRVIVSAMGRVRSCSPTGMPGHAAC